MAEFKEVVEKRNRMCKHYVNCTGCPLKNQVCDSFNISNIEKLEEIVMSWEEPIKELTIEDADELPKGIEIEVRETKDSEWRIRKFITTHANRFWCESGFDDVCISNWRYARLLKEI